MEKETTTDRDSITPMMENQMEKITEYEMETGCI